VRLTKKEKMKQYECRYCSDTTTDRSAVCSPCLCDGTGKWIHLECLYTWLRYSKQLRCPECHFEYCYRIAYRSTENKRRLFVQIHIELLAILIVSTVYSVFYIEHFFYKFGVKIGFMAIHLQKELSTSHILFFPQDKDGNTIGSALDRNPYPEDDVCTSESPFDYAIVAILGVLILYSCIYLILLGIRYPYLLRKQQSPEVRHIVDLAEDSMVKKNSMV